MQRTPKNSRRNQYILAPILSLVCVIALLFWQLSHFLSLNQKIDHTDQVIAKINLLERQIVDLEAGVRGYFITGDPIILEPYQRAKLDLPGTIASLRNLTRENPPQGRHLDRIAAHLIGWEPLAERAISMKKTGADLTPLIQSRRGKALIDSIRLEIGEMHSFEEALKAESAFSAQTTSKWAFWVLLVFFTLLAVWLFWSLTMRHRWEIAIQEGFERELQANLVKDDFLATLSHELRTPLTAILSWVQLLRRGKLDPEKENHGLEILEQSAKAQGQLIDDLLDISMIQAGKLKLNIQKIDPVKVTYEAIEAAQGLAASKSIQFEVAADPAIKHCFADPARVKQILWNLIANSVKFSPQGSKVWIGLDRNVSEAGERIRIQVRDNGKGINPEFMPSIFERFTQADCTSTRTYSGLGLGLAIVRKLVEMHDGNVSVESPGEGKGATFTISLPVKPKNEIEMKNAEVLASEPEAQAEVSLRGLRILIVDDEASAREVLTFILESFGAEVKSADSASVALTILERFKPDVLVSDIAMPKEDGYFLIGEIRRLNSELRKTPALALTAYAGREDIERVNIAGFQSHIAKPVDANKLVRAIARLAG